MRDASRGLIALLVAFAFVMTAAVAFAAKHVEMSLEDRVGMLEKPSGKFSGNASAAFGQLTADDDSSFSSGTGSATYVDSPGWTTWSSTIELNLRGTGSSKDGSLTGKARLRVRTRTHGLGARSNGYLDPASVTYSEIIWKPMPALAIRFGRFGIGATAPMSGQYNILSPVGHLPYWKISSAEDGIDFAFDAGVVKVGLAILAECDPGCGGGYSASGTAAVQSGPTPYTATGLEQQQTMIPWVTGSFGAISFRVALPSTSATQVSSVTTTTAGVTSAVHTDLSLDGGGTYIGVAFKGAGFGVALDIDSFTDDAVSIVGAATTGAAAPSDKEQTGTGIKVTFGALTLSTYSRDTEGGLSSKTDSQLKVKWVIPVGKGIIYPEYTSATTGDLTGLPDKTNTLIRLVGNVGF